MMTVSNYLYIAKYVELTDQTVSLPQTVISIGFEQPSYTVGEDAGSLDDLILLIKEDGGLSERNIPVNVQLSTQRTATRGVYVHYLYNCRLELHLTLALEAHS